MNVDVRAVQKIRNSMVVSSMCCELEELAYQCDFAEASMHLWKDKKAFVSPKPEARRGSSKQTLINEYFM